MLQNNFKSTFGANQVPNREDTKRKKVEPVYIQLFALFSLAKGLVANINSLPTNVLFVNFFFPFFYY